MSFSVLISVYEKNNADHLSLALFSLIEQTLKPAETILVVDGYISLELKTIIKSFRESFGGVYKQIQIETNKGLASALNEGLIYCSHELVARMDADDISYPQRFETQYHYMLENPEIAVVGCDIQEFNRLPGDLNRFRSLPGRQEEIIEFSKWRNPLNHPSVMFRKSAVLNVGSYQNMPLFEDFYLWMRLLKADYKLVNIKKPLLHFRVGNNMVGRRSGWRYLRCELAFLRTCFNEKHINVWEYSMLIPIKILLRLMPLWILKRFYRYLLRS